jgi:hypothetical protein
MFQTFKTQKLRENIHCSFRHGNGCKKIKMIKDSGLTHKYFEMNQKTNFILHSYQQV